LARKPAPPGFVSLAHRVARPPRAAPAAPQDADEATPAEGPRTDDRNVGKNDVRGPKAAALQKRLLPTNSNVREKPAGGPQQLLREAQETYAAGDKEKALSLALSAATLGGSQAP